MYDAGGNDLMHTETRNSWKIKNFDAQTMQFVGEESTSDIHFYTNTDNIDGNYYNIYKDDDYYKPVTLKVVGVLRPSRSSYVSLMPSSIGYLSSLKDDLYSDVSEGGRGAKLAQLAAGNFYINRGTDDARYNSAGWPDGLASLNKTIKDVYASLDGSSTSTSISENTLENVLSSAYLFRNYYSNNGDPGFPGFTTSGGTFLYWNRWVGGDFKESSITNLPGTPTTAYDSSSTEWIKFITFWKARITSPDFYNGTSSDWSAIDFEAYFNGYSLVSSILIFPVSLTKKDALHDYLDAYNAKKQDVDKILWTDVMQTFTSSLSVLIQIISIVLLVFAAISLVVSSVMTGIITYVSVVERTKEIGILRACGARKKDIGRLFEAECTIIGFGAGIIGVGVAYLLCIPINLIINHQYPGNNLSSIATLNPIHALILLALGVVLALVSGLIPSRMAAKKDPVVALRTE
jgi:ABC-type antimicrobial peptide transport system permease subunit